MKTNLRMYAMALGVVGAALLGAPNAGAQCLPNMPAKATGTSFLLRSNHVSLLPVTYQDDDRARREPGIVGFWHVTFTAKTMGGSAITDTVVDNALVVWHADGTEIMNSARPPQDGNFCLGVWKRTGESTYKLNHFAWLANDYTPGTPNGVVGDPSGPTHIVESVTLGPDRNHYSGTFSLDAYDTSGTITQSFTGVVNATRIAMDTTVADLLGS